MKSLIIEFCKYMQKQLSEGKTFNQGLCMEILTWARNEADMDVIDRGALQHYMKSLFKQEGLNSNTPFNKNITDYACEQRERALYLNEARMTWINDYASYY